jgi:hypothetical protein
MLRQSAKSWAKKHDASGKFLGLFVALFLMPCLYVLTAYNRIILLILAQVLLMVYPKHQFRAKVIIVFLGSPPFPGAADLPECFTV